MRNLSLLALALLVAAGCNSSVTDPLPDKTLGMALRQGGATTGTAETKSEFGPVGEGFGTLTGRFIVGGSAPDPKKIVADKDVEVCSLHPLFDESVVVSDGGLTNVVVYLRPIRGVNVPIAPAYENVAPEVVFDNKNCRFEPHVISVWAGKQKLTVKNSDPVAHNTNLGELGNPLVPKNDQTQIALNGAASKPIAASCNIHPWMKGYMFPTDNPYVAISGKGGSFTIKDIPTGKWEFLVWHEKLSDKGFNIGPVAKGRWTLDIVEGENKHEIQIPADQLQ